MLALSGYQNWTVLPFLVFLPTVFYHKPFVCQIYKIAEPIPYVVVNEILKRLNSLSYDEVELLCHDKDEVWKFSTTFPPSKAGFWMLMRERSIQNWIRCFKMWFTSWCYGTLMQPKNCIKIWAEDQLGDTWVLYHRKSAFQSQRCRAYDTRY